MRTVPTTLALLLVLGFTAARPAHAGLLEQGRAWLDRATGDESTEGQALSRQELVAGLKETLRTGVDKVIAQLGQRGGFSADPEIHIPLPDSLTTVRSALDRIGQGQRLDELEQRINRAAEIATPRAREIFAGAIADMSLDDARAIYNGADDAATRYFQRHTSDQLADAMGPIVQDSVAQAGVMQAYDGVMGEYESLPFVPDAQANLKDYVVDQGMEGIFHYLAEEEARIRNNPAQRSTELLRKLFGGDP